MGQQQHNFVGLLLLHRSNLVQDAEHKPHTSPVWQPPAASSRRLLPFLCEKYGVRPHEACIVGDRLDTDIALGKAGGLRTVLPLTGVTTPGDLAAADVDLLPDFVVPSFGALMGF